MALRFESVLANSDVVNSASRCLLLGLLPTELIHKVFGLLDFRILLKCREVS